MKYIQHVKLEAYSFLNFDLSGSDLQICKNLPQLI